MQHDTTPTSIAVASDPVLDWLRQFPPLREERPGEPDAPLNGATHAGGEAIAAAAREVRLEIHHRRHRDHPTWDVPMIPEDLFPLRAAGVLGHDMQHRPVCAIVRALRPGEAARVRSDHPVGPLCHALDDRCAAEVTWSVERDGPEEWTVLLTRR